MWEMQNNGRKRNKRKEYMNNLTPAEEIQKAEEMAGPHTHGEITLADSYFNPEKNPEVVSIIKQKDGNYKLWGQKNGKMMQLRGIKPEDVLSEFLTTS